MVARFAIGALLIVAFMAVLRYVWLPTPGTSPAARQRMAAPALRPMSALTVGLFVLVLGFLVAVLMQAAGYGQNTEPVTDPYYWRVLALPLVAAAVSVWAVKPSWTEAVLGFVAGLATALALILFLR